MCEINDATVGQPVLGLLLVFYKRRAIPHMFHYISISYAAGLWANLQICACLGTEKRIQRYDDDDISNGDSEHDYSSVSPLIAWIPNKSRLHNIAYHKPYYKANDKMITTY